MEPRLTTAMIFGGATVNPLRSPYGVEGAYLALRATAFARISKISRKILIGQMIMTLISREIRPNTSPPFPS